MKKLQEEEREAFKQRYGAYQCRNDESLKWKIMKSMNRNYIGFSIEQSCIHNLGPEFVVLQQTRDGTLAHVPSPNITIIPDITIFIEKNSTDSDIVDGAPVPDGYMLSVGTYKYINVLGASKTIYKFKRVKE